MNGCDISMRKRRLIRRMHEWGRTNGEIAEALGVSTRTVRRWIGRDSLENRPPNRNGRPRVPEREERICELRREGLRSSEIAAEVGLHPVTVTRILQRNGLGLIQEQPDGTIVPIQ